VRAAGEQELLFPLDEGHHRRRDARIRRQLARRALAHALLALGHGRRAAAPAELVRAVPVDELHRAAGERELRVVEHREQGAQALPRHSGGRRGAGVDFRGPAVDAGETP
jgi:hypothetical protein